MCFSRLRQGTGYLLGLSSIFLLLWTLAPRDYVTYCQARRLSGHTSPRDECVCFILEDSAPLEDEEDYLFFSWLDSKWAHLVHYEEVFDSKLKLLTSLWQAILGSRCSATVHAARRWFTLLGDGSHCSVMVHAARRWFTLLGDGSCWSTMAHNYSTTHHGGWTMSLTAQLRSHLLGQAQDSVAQRIQGARGLAVGGMTPDIHGKPHGLRP